MISDNVFHKLEKLPTPRYFYDMDLFNNTLSHVKKLAQRFDFNVHYAIKANSNARILQTVQEQGFGVDCVSGNEIKAAIENGFNGNEILFAGVGKSDQEIEYALEQQILAFNCESVQELMVIDEIAAHKNQRADVALRINPNVDAKTHKYITTGLNENKFGINFSDLPEVLQVLKDCPHLQLKGLHFHIGSQITDFNVFKGLCLRVNQIQQWFIDRNVSIEHINLGGGLGINYHKPELEPMPDFEQYFSIFNEFLKRQPHQKVHFELGRALVAQCGYLISKVLFIKKSLNTEFVILDAGMTELMRPALYQSFHKIENLSSSKKIKNYDVVGPVCESTDCFGKAVPLNLTSRGDLIAIHSAGAYGEVMQSGYNLRQHLDPVYSDNF